MEWSLNEAPEVHPTPQAQKKKFLKIEDTP